MYRRKGGGLRGLFVLLFAVPTLPGTLCPDSVGDISTAVLSAFHGDQPTRYVGITSYAVVYKKYPLQLSRPETVGDIERIVVDRPVLILVAINS
jgi:hypothetical protein